MRVTTVAIAIMACFIAITHGYEVWLSDQGGAQGALLRIYREVDLEAGRNAPDLVDIHQQIPEALSTTGASVARLHGITTSPDNNYAALNFVSSGHLVLMSTKTRKMVCLFRTTNTTTGRQNHMSFFTASGSHILVSNQNGRLLERVRVDHSGGLDSAVTGFVFEASATADLVGGDRILGQPIAVDLDDTDDVNCSVEGVVANNQPLTTPLGSPKQAVGTRPRNAVICAVPVRNETGAPRYVFATLGGGGLFVLDYSTTPMSIVAEYDVSSVRAAGCGGVQDGQHMYINAGTSGPGISEFSLFKFPLSGFPGSAPNEPRIEASFADANNGLTPVAELRRDAHGLNLVRGPFGQSFVYQFDRIQDSIDIFSTTQFPNGTLQRVGHIDLRESGVCGTTPGAPSANLPTPDLGQVSPFGNIVYVSLRGPRPITVAHAAVGSCPGLGMIRLSADRLSGRLTQVFNTTLLNEAGDLNLSDNHMATVVRVRSTLPSCNPRHSHARRF